MGQAAEGSAVNNMSCRFEYFGSHGSAEVGRWSEISSESDFILREGRGRVTKHYPVVPCELANGTNISSLAGHDGLGHLAIGQDMADHRMRTNERLQLKAMVPKDLGQSGP